MPETPSTTRPAWFRRLPIRPPTIGSFDPAADRAAALAKLAELSAQDADLPEATRTRLLEPDAPTDLTLVIWHGFTNAPPQFLAVAEHLRDAGFRVLLPRLPRHGLPDLLNRDLAKLTAQELVAFIDTCIDIAAGLGDRVWVIGLSAGGSLAAFAAATRAEIGRAVLMAPLVAPSGFPMPAVRLLVKFPRIVPNYYMWWDRKVKADLSLSQSPHAYPGFPVPGVMPFLHLSESLFDGSVPVNHRLERLVLVTNPNDEAVGQDAAHAFATRVFEGDADYYGEAHVAESLKWTHDFVDPWSTAGGSTRQVAAILAAALGVGEPTAGGVLVTPLVTEQP